MELVVNIYNEEQLNKLKDYSKFVLIADKYFSNYCLEQNDSYSLIKKANLLGITPIVKMNTMLLPDKLELFKKTILSYKEFDCLFLLTDLGACNIALNLELAPRVIYDPVTMITNSLDASIYASYGFNAIGLSEEITIYDVNSIINKINYKVMYQIFGYHLMMHSKRKLISLYSTYKDINIDNKLLSLEETTRNEKYPIIENENGTFIFRSYAISLLDEIKKSNIYYGVIDSFNLSFDTYIQIVKIYYDYINLRISYESALFRINELEIHIENGFTYEDSEYKKEKMY